MSAHVYHQVGHFPGWNVASLQDDGCGDGLILSPVHQKRASIVNFDSEIKARSLFDPQYYLPNSPKAKLATYPFFPESITGGFSTNDFHLLALESARGCIEFQSEQGFKGIVIPARFIDRMATKFFEIQEEYTVAPFLKAAAGLGTKSDLYLTLPLTVAMLQDGGFRTQLLNWVTGFPEIRGVYVLVNDDRKSKQIRSSEFLFAYMEFLHHLAQSGLSVIASHLNTESVLLSIVDGVSLTFGSFENTRIFTLDKFIESEEERRAPKARIYLPSLLNWVQFDQAMQIRDDEPKLWSEIYRPTPYSDAVIERGMDPHFNQQDLYRHHFVCMYRQLKDLTAVGVRERFAVIRDQFKAARSHYEQIEEMPIDLDTHGSGAHIQPWLDALTRYYRAFLK